MKWRTLRMAVSVGAVTLLSIAVAITVTSVGDAAVAARFHPKLTIFDQEGRSRV